MSPSPPLASFLGFRSRTRTIGFFFGADFDFAFIWLLPPFPASSLPVCFREVAGAINRRPKAGEFRSNLAAGGTAEQTELTPREREICAAIGPELKRRGLLFVGIDVIGGMMTEINVTSPTGIVAIDKFNGTDTAGLIWDAIEARVADRRKG